ncbi:MAG: hypothetical protein PHF94_03100 [Methanothrix sp.]|nr:hypothetical protein [Methanothrix sp.]MDD4580067.1 hypothetical protein [Methanothrix sp.]
MNNSITIKGEKYCIDDLLLLSGEDEIKEPERIKGYLLMMAKALRNPMRLPWLIKDIFNLCIKEEDQRDMRLCLIRVQVEAELKMNQDIQRYQQRRYVAQVIEILLFNELLLAPREPVEEGDIE